MNYQHKEDINLATDLNVENTDKQMASVVHRTASAFDALSSIDSTSRETIALLLRSFLPTHKSIRLLLKQEDHSLGPDAMSLAREQVEKVFIIALILDDPQKWISVYLKDGWRRTYENQQMEQSECGHLPRYQEFLKASQESSDRLKKVLNISDTEQQAVEFKFNNPGQTMPAHLKGAIIREFPTPGQIRDKLKDPTTSALLSRWHREYKHLCGYNHIGLDKLETLSLKDSRSRLSPVALDALFNKVLVGSLIISYVAIASTCTQSYIHLGVNIEVLAELTKFWEILRERSLLAKVVWDIHSQHLLPHSLL